jgi:hypothetical protein
MMANGCESDFGGEAVRQIVQESLDYSPFSNTFPTLFPIMKPGFDELL